MNDGIDDFHSDRDEPPFEPSSLGRILWDIGYAFVAWTIVCALLAGSVAFWAILIRLLLSL